MILASVTVRCPSNGRSASSTSGLLGPATQSSTGRAACSCVPWPAVLRQRPHRPHTTPTAGQAIPPLHSPTPLVILRRQQPYTAAEPVNPPTPLRMGIRCHVFPGSASSPSFLGLAVMHRPGALGAAWSTWSRNDFHQTWTVRGEADSWVHGRSKEVPPYYAQKK